VEVAVIAYKFLCPGRVAPFTRHVWPAPGGEWVTDAPSQAIAICLDGVHACRARDLPLWLDEELWEVELDGAIVESDSKLAAERGRLTRQITAWNPGTISDFALACAMRTRDQALWALRRSDTPQERDAADSLARAFTAREVQAVCEAAEATASEEAKPVLGYAADAAGSALDDACAEGAYIAAHAAGVLHGADAEIAERAWQAAWLAERLELRG
jgi:hypothetical protein